ncbi:MAG: O-antigen ligase family protein [Acidobacteria bacterium]|nr:O-antigen ligase family protein [Acidobacteriota bacterium]
MPRQLATLLCIALIAFLVRRARDPFAQVSAARWIVFAWVFLAGSRFLSHWLSIVGLRWSGGATAADGSPIDMAAFALLIMAATAALVGRDIRWRHLLGNNKVLLALYVFGLFSVFWSPDPIVALKRWIKSVGTLWIACLVLTDRRPWQALRSVVVPLGLVLLPLSILFIKYYPELGRQYHSTGAQMMTGVTMQKNSLGELCMLVGLYASWNLLHLRTGEDGLGRRLRWPVWMALAGMIGWLMIMADSATALVCLLAGIGIHLLACVPAIRRRPASLAAVLFVGTSGYLILQASVDVNTLLLELLNRRPDLTTRVPMWQDILAVASNTLTGFGWQSFTLTPQHHQIYDKWQVVSVHNTYLDLYLNLGLIGLGLYLAVWLTGMWTSVRMLSLEYAPAVLRISFLVVVLLYGWTETVDLGVSNMYLLLLLATVTHGSIEKAKEQGGVRRVSLKGRHDSGTALVGRLGRRRQPRRPYMLQVPVVRGGSEPAKD